MSVQMVLGAQWGDEGKGKLVDVLCGDVDVVARFNGGNNAGHTIVVDGVKYACHLLPSGFIHDKVLNVIGNGVVVHIPSLLKELENFKQKKGEAIEKKLRSELVGKTEEEIKSALVAADIPKQVEQHFHGRLWISSRAHLVFDFHQAVDGRQEGQRADKAIGTTRKGIGPTYSSKMARSGLRMCDLQDFDQFESLLTRLAGSWQASFPDLEIDIKAEVERYREYHKLLSPIIVDTVKLMNDMYKDNKQILCEGANATMLDIDFGTYPYVTSSSTVAGGASTGLGLAPTKLKDRYGVVKAYTTRVGEGPFPCECLDAIGEKLRDVGGEFGTTTGRPRRCGWLDLVLVKYTHTLNDYTAINLTKLDVLTGIPELKVATAYKKGDDVIDYFPASLRVLGELDVVYETLPGWTEDISKITKWEDLPENARNYVLFIEKFLGTPVRWIGVGPGRESLISH